jgi:serine protease inhibitor
MMKTLICLLMVTTIMISCEKDKTVNNPQTPEDLNISATSEQVIEADNEFGFDLFQQVISLNPSVNHFISPTSVALALAMTYNGASGETKAEMEATLRKSGLTNEEINSSYQSLIAVLKSVDQQVLLEIANSIWYSQCFHVLPEFISVNQEYYDAQVSLLDFSDQESPDIINEWVSEKTHKRINSVINEIPADVVMYLINAIYFKGKWKYEFDKSKTVDGGFTTSDGETVTIKYMNQTAGVSQMSTDDFSMIELPYGRGNFSMLVLLPNEGKTTQNILDALTSENWNLWMSELSLRNLDIRLPKFTFEYNHLLNKELISMGMVNAFGDLADFSGINGTGNLCISKVIHKSFVDVNEEGTEAAAVTVVAIEVTSMPQNQVFNVDHPFIFAIRETTTGAILFLGRVQDPLIKENGD